VVQKLMSEQQYSTLENLLNDLIRYHHPPSPCYFLFTSIVFSFSLVSLPYCKTNILKIHCSILPTPSCVSLSYLLNKYSNSNMEKSFLFDVVSKIYIATDSNPVIAQSHLYTYHIEYHNYVSYVYVYVFRTIFTRSLTSMC
jgi:hypothetical protein